MKREFIETSIFKKTWKNAGYNEENLRDLQTALLKNPESGIPIKNGLRKYRHPFENTGKSGGSRVIFYDYQENGQIYLLYCFRKKEQDNLTEDQKKILSMLIEKIRGANKNGR